MQQVIKKDKNKNLHRQLLEILRKQALSTQCGERFPSELTISRRYKVSRSTVNRVYNELEQAGYLIRKQGSGTFVPVKHSYRICFLLPFDPITQNHDAGIVYYGEALRKRCLEQSIPFEYLEASLQRSSRELNTELFKLINKNTVLVVYGYFFRRLFKTFAEKNLQMIFLSQQHELDALYHNSMQKWPRLEIDRRGGMASLITELASRGSQRIALLHALSHPRHPLLRGFKIGLRINKLKYVPELICYGAGGIEYTQRRLDTLFELRKLYDFDTLVIINTSIANDVLYCLKTMDKNLKAPVKVAVVGSEPPQENDENDDILFMYPPHAATVSENILSIAAVGCKPVTRKLSMEIIRLPARQPIIDLKQ